MVVFYYTNKYLKEKFIVNKTLVSQKVFLPKEGLNIFLRNKS